MRGTEKSLPLLGTETRFYRPKFYSLITITSELLCKSAFKVNTKQTMYEYRNTDARSRITIALCVCVCVCVCVCARACAWARGGMQARACM